MGISYTLLYLFIINNVILVKEKDSSPSLFLIEWFFVFPSYIVWLINNRIKKLKKSNNKRGFIKFIENK